MKHLILFCVQQYCEIVPATYPTCVKYFNSENWMWDFEREVCFTYWNQRILGNWFQSCVCWLL